MASLLRKVVHNEAMKNDPPEIYGWRVYALACSVGSTSSQESSMSFANKLQACFGGTLFGMETGIISGVLTMTPFKEFVPSSHDLMVMADRVKQIWPFSPRESPTSQPRCQHCLGPPGRLFSRGASRFSSG